MDRLTLHRLESSDEGTFGKITIGSESLFTLELPWRDNANNISCIPCGIYECRSTLSYHFKRKMYLVMNVNNRDGIRIHAANFAGDRTLGLKAQLNGCIALGLHIGLMGGQKCLLLSSPAVRKFESIMNGESFILEVKNV